MDLIRFKSTPAILESKGAAGASRAQPHERLRYDYALLLLIRDKRNRPETSGPPCWPTGDLSDSLCE